MTQILILMLEIASVAESYIIW